MDPHIVYLLLGGVVFALLRIAFALSRIAQQLKRLELELMGVRHEHELARFLRFHRGPGDGFPNTSVLGGVLDERVASLGTWDGLLERHDEEYEAALKGEYEDEAGDG